MVAKLWQNSTMKIRLKTTNLKPNSTIILHISTVYSQGRSQDFSKGGVTLCQSEGTHQMVTMDKVSSWHFRHLLKVVWLKKACKSGGHRHPRTPLASPWLVNFNYFVFNWTNLSLHQQSVPVNVNNFILNSTISSPHQRHKFVNFNTGILLNINSENYLTKRFFWSQDQQFMPAVHNVQPPKRCQAIANERYW